MTNNDVKPTKLTLKATDDLITDDAGNRAYRHNLVLAQFRETVYGEAPTARIENNKQQWLCSVPVETFQALRKIDWSVAEAIKGEAVRPSPIGPLSNLCKKDGGQEK
jgi:hypothetical protein